MISGMDSYMQGTVDARDRNGFHPFLAGKGAWDYSKGYVRNRFSSGRPSRVEIDLSNPSPHIRLKPSLKMVVKGTLTHWALYPWTTVLNGRSLRKKKARM